MGRKQIGIGDFERSTAKKRTKSQPVLAKLQDLVSGKCRDLSYTTEGRLDDLIETAKAHIRANGEHPFRVMNRQFGFEKTRLRGMLKNGCKIHVLKALANLFMALHQLLCKT
jgi:hypothetical protein